MFITNIGAACFFYTIENIFNIPLYKSSYS